MLECIIFILLGVWFGQFEFGWWWLVIDIMFVIAAVVVVVVVFDRF